MTTATSPDGGQTSPVEPEVSTPEVTTEESATVTPEATEPTQAAAAPEESPTLSEEQRAYIDTYFEELTKEDADTAATPAPEGAPSASDPNVITMTREERRRMEQALRDQVLAEQNREQAKQMERFQKRSTLASELTRQARSYYERDEDLPANFGEEALRGYEAQYLQEAGATVSTYLEEEANVALGEIPGFADAVKTDPRLLEPLQEDARTAREFFGRRYTAAYEHGIAEGQRRERAGLAREVRKQAVEMAKGMAARWALDSGRGQTDGRAPRPAARGTLKFSDEEIARRRGDKDWWEANRTEILRERGMLKD